MLCARMPHVEWREALYYDISSDFSILLQPHAIVCTVRFPHFTLSLYFTKVIKHIFVASCFGYLKDVGKRKYENYFSNNIYR